MSYQCSKCNKNISSVIPWLCTCSKAYHPRCIKSLAKVNSTFCCPQQFLAYEATLTPRTLESITNVFDLTSQPTPSGSQTPTSPILPNLDKVVKFPPQWSGSSTDDKLTFLAGIFLNHVNNSNHENRVLAQSVSNNTNNINTNTNNIQTNTSDIHTLRKEETESEKKT